MAKDEKKKDVKTSSQSVPKIKKEVKKL